MHDLIPLGTPLPGALTTAEIDATMALRRGGEGAGDQGGLLRLRLARLRRLVRLQGRRGPASAPGGRSPPTSPASPTAAARPPLSAGVPPRSATTTRWPAMSHRPTNQEGVRAVLRGIRRTIGSAKQGKAPATADLIGQMVALCPDNMIGCRNRALLCLGFAGAFRRSELCALEVADLTEVPDGLRILIRRKQGRPGRAGAGGRDTTRLQAPAGRGGADGAGSGGDQQRARVPSSDAGRAGVVRGHGGRQRGAGGGLTCSRSTRGAAFL